jgi:periplasmic mercuric ion binding protein
VSSRRSTEKRFSIVLIVLALAWSLHAETRTAAFEVSGWTCASCASATRIALKKLDGVQDVKTDAEKKEALVTYDDSKVTTNRMVEAIAKLGYKATLRNGAAPASPARPQASASPTVGQDTSPSPERVSFFEVPLECGAAEGLGCGSAAKPILKDLIANSRIDDARINPESWWPQRDSNPCRGLERAVS